MNKNIVRQVLVALAVIALIVVNGLANALPLNNLTTGEISDRFEVFFVPAGYVFAIWGLIYLGLIAFGIYQALPSQRANPRLSQIGYPFVASCVANIAWLFLWHYEQFPLTLVAMFSLLLLLIWTYSQLGIGKRSFSVAESWLVNIPFSVYLGWITVATIANVTSVLDYWNWGGWGLSGELWAVIMLAAGWLVATAVSFTRGDIAYLLVIVWAFAGIGVKQADTAAVATAAWVATVATVLALVIGTISHRRRMTKEISAT